MEFTKSHLSFYSKGVLMEKLFVGEMFITNKFSKPKALFFYGIERKMEKFVKFKYKEHGDPAIKWAIWRLDKKIYRRAY